MRLYRLDTPETEPTATPIEASPIAPASEGEGEGELEELLNASPDALFDEPILLFARQPGLTTGIPDLLGLDRFGNSVVFELKRGDSGSESASEASIVSQPQLYAQALDRYDYHELDALTDEYRNGDWPVPSTIAETDSLIEAYNDFFEQDRVPWELNRAQRLAIVAERITLQTRQSARWLRDRGLDIQAVEVQRFEAPSGESFFGATTIVDYDETRTQNSSQSKPGDRVFTIRVFTTAFPSIKDVLSADRMDPLLGNLTTNYPYLESQAPGHPEPVRYALRVNPYGDNEVKVAIDATGDGNMDAANYLRKNRDLFRDRGFTVSQRDSMRVVVDTWEDIEVSDLRQEEFIERVAARYVDLVNLGHEVFDVA
ncbi:hypothetical protein [Halorientalis pallida]|uniref:Uncharacterized protein n=1 Tax=Halorientalis pallida TaxID=2479928 RepID=A0A498KTN4_9EURY|nr:hypothetical protein [Halorientalis pallida]RXK48016.1 hypothetical protein EAF64_15420 [Halorientalis pallida]